MADNEALFTPELVFFDWECATPDEVFARLEGELAPRGYIAEGWLNAVRTREDAYPTGLAMPAANIAIPHTDPGFVAKPYIAVVKPAVPVTFNAMAGMGAPVPAQIVINLGIAEPGGQVEALAGAHEYLYGRRCRSRRARPDHVPGHGRRHPSSLLSGLGTVPNCRQKRNVPNCRLPELVPFAPKWCRLTCPPCTRCAAGAAL